MLSDFQQRAVDALQAEKSRQGLTVQQIIDKAAALGKPISPKTARKIFSPGEKTEGFQDYSLFAAACALGVDLLNDSAGGPLATRLRQEVERREALEALLSVKNDQIAHRTEEIAEYAAQVASMRATVQLYQVALKRKNKLLRVVATALVLLTAAAVVLFATDMLQPPLGWWRGVIP